MLKTKCFIVGIILPSSLQVNGGTYCPSTPVGAIVRKQKLDKERHELEQIRCRKKHRSKKNETVEVKNKRKYLIKSKSKMKKS